MNGMPSIAEAMQARGTSDRWRLGGGVVLFLLGGVLLGLGLAGVAAVGSAVSGLLVIGSVLLGGVSLLVLWAPLDGLAARVATVGLFVGFVGLIVLGKSTPVELAGDWRWLPLVGGVIYLAGLAVGFAAVLAAVSTGDDPRPEEGGQVAWIRGRREGQNPSASTDGGEDGRRPEPPGRDD